MRINHNIAALNTYRQLSNNGVSTQKSLEKLSSGLRINRAGDDAAGLAISEKMRGQIRGLEMASKNAQDGISLIQTAEGALNETHSILQRMKELATQAANGTNTEADRGEIQKEINQLTSEINRIGNTTEFNTQKLLKGGADAVGGVSTVAVGTPYVAGSPAVAQVVSSTFSGENFDATDTITVGSETYTMQAGDTSGTNVKIGSSLNESIDNLAAAINANSSSAFTAVSDGNGKLTITQKSAAAGVIALSVNEVVSTGTTTSSAPNVDTPYQAATPGTAATFTFSISANLEENETITIDGTTLKAVASGAVAGEFNIGADAAATAANIASALSGGTTNYTVGESGGIITLTQKIASDPAGALPNVSVASAGGSGFQTNLQIGANTGQSFTLDINDMRAAALLISNVDNTASRTVTIDGKDYTIKFNQDKVVTDGTDNTGTEYAMDVSDIDNATAAIKALDDAINTVSAERSKLGAFQNRLDHTINNLGTSAENLTAAESRIRDVDMAKEMMEFTKNSILSQAAQAMLAQANQQPQGVLQLLR